ncbi:hypothetical protein GCM10027271_02510 [Saccharopolyspora gloriosae]
MVSSNGRGGGGGGVLEVGMGGGGGAGAGVSAAGSDRRIPHPERASSPAAHTPPSRPADVRPLRAVAVRELCMSFTVTKAASVSGELRRAPRVVIACAAPMR